MDQTAILAQGGLGFAVVLLTFGIKVLWVRYQAALERNHEDQAAMLPALEAATAAVRAALEESIRSRALAERERQ